MTALARRWLGVAALLGAAGVMLGAFGAHGLPGWLSQLGYATDDIARRMDLFETAARYQLFHALALAVTAQVVDRTGSRMAHLAAWAFLVGVIVFSGLLYALTVVGPALNWLGAVVPLGGLSMIAGWLLLAVAALRDK
jgi:uncharacterized membrane protein YgdD (TMEM256/DUF423 family)